MLENNTFNAELRITMKDIKEIQKILKNNFPKLEQKYQVKSIGTFGSYVRNEQKQESDIDLLVTFKKKPSLFKFIELEDYLSELLNTKVDLVMESALKPNIGKHIKDEVVMI
jgi:predicted nucleotidyltransferase